MIYNSCGIDDIHGFSLDLLAKARYNEAKGGGEIMNTQMYSKENFLEMDPMHDSYASKIHVLNNTLIITYDELDKCVQNADGSPCYKYKRLVIKYEFDSFCDAKLYYGKNKYKIIDLQEQIGIFNKLMDGCVFMSYKYAVDCCKEITLDFNIRKRRKDRFLHNKYWGVEISLDATMVTYDWM